MDLYRLFCIKSWIASYETCAIIQCYYSNNRFSLLVHRLALRLAWICNEWHDNRQANLHSRCYPKRLTCSWSCNNIVLSHRAACVLNESARHLRHAAKRMQPPVTKVLHLAFLSRSPIRLALFFLHARLPHTPLLPTPSPLQKEERRGAGGLEITFTWTLFTAISQAHGLCL